MTGHCSTCGNRDYLCQRCRMDALEDRHGSPADQDPDHWVLDDDLWHASIVLDDGCHTCVCGDEIPMPVSRVTQDLRYVPDKYDAPVCRDCVVALEDARAETVPDDATFERASEIATDGGESIDDRLERIRGTWNDDDPLVLAFQDDDAGDPVVADVDGELRFLSSRLIYPRETGEGELTDAVDRHGLPEVTPLSEHEDRFDAGDFEDLAEDRLVTEGGRR